MIAGRGHTVTLTGLSHIPHVQPGDDIADLIIAAVAAEGLAPRDDDVLAVAQKIVSKAEGRFVRLSSIMPSRRAVELAEATNKDARLVEVILRESSEVVRHREGVIIAAHRLGYVMANAGIDRSNISADEDSVLLLPENPDTSCAKLKEKLDAAFRASVGVVMTDSFGRAWRRGVVGVALGTAGVPSLKNKVGHPDLYGRPLQVTEIAIADQIAAAATLVMGEADEGVPAVHIRGLSLALPHSTAAALVRPKALDLFR